MDINQSSYLFRQEQILELIEILLCSGIIVFLIIRLIKRFKITNSRLQEIGKTIIGILLTSFIYFLFFYPTIKKTIALKNNGVEIKGETVQWINTGDDRRIEYSFEINGITYTKQCDVVYNGKEIENIKCPGGFYVVIYDKDDPSNSVMDLKRPSK